MKCCIAQDIFKESPEVEKIYMYITESLILDLKAKNISFKIYFIN